MEGNKDLTYHSVTPFPCLTMQRYKIKSRNASDLPILTLGNLVIVQKITCCAALPQLGTKETGLAALFRF